MRSRQPIRAGRRRAFVDDDTALRAGIWALAVLGVENAIVACARQGIAVTRAASEGVNSGGGVLVPDDFMPAIINLREATGIFRQAAEVVPMSRENMPWPRRTGGFTPYFTAENTVPTESQATFDNINLTAKKLAVLGRLSSELSEDSAVDLAELFFGEVAYALAKKEDACGFSGDGTSTYGGMRGICPILLDGNHGAGKVVAAAGHNTFATLDVVDLTNLMAALPAVALPGAEWFVSQFGFATTLCRLAATAGGIIMDEDDALSGAMIPTFLGFPVRVTQELPQIGTTLTGRIMLLFGDLSLAAALGDRRVVTVKRSDQRYFDQDQIGILGTERFDINNHDLGDASTAGPIVGLQAP